MPKRKANWRLGKRKTKYSSVKTLVDTATCRVVELHSLAPEALKKRKGLVKCDSKKEAQRLIDLLLLQRGKVIKNLNFQKRFKIYVENSLICTYVADFVYEEQGEQVIEDAKGFETQVFKLKWKLMLATFPQYKYRITK